MSTAITIDVRDAISPMLARLQTGLAHTSRLNAKVGADILSLVRDHLLGIAESRHATAERLGAGPSGFWGNPTGYTSMKSDSTGATISINHVGIGRAVHDVTILPGPGKKFLTIPLIAAAYNQRAYRVAGLVPIPTKQGGLVLVMDPKNGGGIAWYLLVREVHQKQDRTLLPPDAAFAATAQQSAIEYVNATLEGRAA